MRSQLIDRGRKVAAKIFKLPAEWFDSSYDRSNVPELQALLKPEANRTAFSKFAPILYPKDRNRERQRNDMALLRAPELPLVCL